MVDIPPADLIIHGGDMTSTGAMGQLTEFADWFETLPHANKVYIAGNHDTTIDTEYYVSRGHERFHANAPAFRDTDTDPRQYSEQCRTVFTAPREKCCYLEDSSVYLSTDTRIDTELLKTAEPTENNIESGAAAAVPVSTSSAESGGPPINTITSPVPPPASSQVRLVPEARNAVGESNIHIYGSPWQPEFCDWAFNLQRGPDCARVWAKIPAGTDVLVTHGPPQGRGDLAAGPNGFPCGCADMLAVIEGMEAPPRVHIFGHIHEGYGHWADGKTLFINASTCTYHYKPMNKPVLFHLPFDRSLPATIVEY